MSERSFFFRARLQPRRKRSKFDRLWPLRFSVK
jgi:hypothetical protein